MTRRIIGVPPSVKNDRGEWVKNTPPPAKEFKLSDFLFDKQLRWVEDPHPFKIAVCSRRAGKTVACAADLIKTALDSPETVSLYITLSRNNAKKLIWRELLKINKNYNLAATPDSTELSLTFPNGAIIYVSGAKDANEIEKFRGLPLKLVYVDEAQSFRAYIRELIDDVISAALLDHAGTLCLIGTPGPVPTGYYYECWQSENWAKHTWTFFDNPYIAEKSKMTHQALLERELIRRGVTAEDPSIQREFFGRWVLDSDSLWIHYDKTKNHFTELAEKKEKYNYILGIDIGFVDADALAVLAWSESDPVTYLVEESVEPKKDITSLVERINDIRSRYDISKMVIDEGGLGKKIAEEIRRRHHIPVQPADKARKQENVAFLNDALRRGHFKAKSASKFAQDSYLVEIDRNKSTPDRIRISDKYHSDIIDAVLYGFKESPAFTYTPPKPKLKPGTPEWAKAQQDAMFEAAVEWHQEQADKARYENGDYN